MCGFVCRRRRPGASDPGDFLARATSVLAHRGPDGHDVWVGPAVEMGHRRLAIISPSDGQQPFVDDESGCVLVYNGEIYNFKELRAELESRGHRFRTRCDTEVLLRGYLADGPDIVKRLNGIFAFVLYDPRRDRLFGARDPLGVKPFYYHRAGDRFVMASEIKALFEDPAVPRRLRPEALFEYLIFGFVAGTDTLYEGVRQLAPGDMFLEEGGRLVLSSYWRPREQTPLERAEGPALAALDERLAAGVARQMVSDVPLGVLLSGGVDSSLLSVYASRIRRDVPAFTLRHRAEGYDETAHAAKVAEVTGAPLHVIDIDSSKALDLLPRAIWFYDEPLIQTNTLGLYLLCEKIAGHGIKVLLSGEGADEVFGGYERYRETLGAVRAGRKEAVLLGRNDVAFPRVERFWPGRPRRFPFRESLVAAGAGFEEGNQILIYDQSTYLPHLLQRQDRMGMAHGIEVRVPFLDVPLVEWANGLAADLKIHPAESKFLLKKLAERFLPRSILYRPKQAFDTPVAESLARGAFRDYFRDTLGPGAAVHGLFDRAGVEGLMADYLAGDAPLWRILWQILCVEVWMKTFSVGLP